jgi:hypothetical protein
MAKQDPVAAGLCAVLRLPMTPVAQLSRVMAGVA